ncbi:MAG: P-II family nitrogen regulator [Oscillospiraceae bacterium]|jgi:nitrogen regulatory protein PII
MCLVVIVLNQTECLNNLLEELSRAGIMGATILDSHGMAHSLYEYDELRFFGSLRILLDPERNESKTILMVCKEDCVSVVSEVVNRITGGLDKPDTGILFTVPVNYVEGITTQND